MKTAASPLSSAASDRKLGLGCVIPFGLLFATIGLAAFWFITLQPLLRMWASADWAPVECEVVSSELGRKSDSDGTTFRVLVRYRYRWEGREWESDRYGFSEGYTNVGVKAMRAAVAAHPSGLRTVCYVDPEEPSFAVLSREISSGVWFGALTLLFPLFGLGMIFGVVRSGRAGNAEARSPLGAASAVDARATTTLDAPASVGEMPLRPANRRVATFVGLAVFALFWNGMLFFIGRHIFEDLNGLFGVVFGLFLLPFIGVGLLMLFLAGSAFSRIFAPAVELKLDPSRLRLGARVPFAWRLGGGGVRRLVIRLTAREEATYRQGTKTSTARSDFWQATLFDSTDALALVEGRGEIALPAEGAVPVFAAKNNRVVWELSFDGELPWRGDIDDHFHLAVQPPPTVSGPAELPVPRSFAGGALTLWTVDRFAPGETLVFTLGRDASDAPGPLTVQLGWFTEGRGTTDAGIVWKELFSDLAPGSDRNFEVRLPSEPWSFAGQLVAVQWRLEVLAAKQKLIVSAPLVIAPGGVEPRLGAMPAWASLSRSRFKFSYKEKR